MPERERERIKHLICTPLYCAHVFQNEKHTPNFVQNEKHTPNSVGSTASSLRLVEVMTVGEDSELGQRSDWVGRNMTHEYGDGKAEREDEGAEREKSEERIIISCPSMAVTSLLLLSLARDIVTAAAISEGLNSKKSIAFIMLRMSWVDLNIEDVGKILSPLIFLRKLSMKENGVTACILHFNVLKTRSSIFCMVLAANTNLDSLTCKSRHKGTTVSSILAAHDTTRDVDLRSDEADLGI